MCSTTVFLNYDGNSHAKLGTHYQLDRGWMPAWVWCRGMVLQPTYKHSEQWLLFVLLISSTREYPTSRYVHVSTWLFCAICQRRDLAVIIAFDLAAILAIHISRTRLWTMTNSANRAVILGQVLKSWQTSIELVISRHVFKSSLYCSNKLNFRHRVGLTCAVAQDRQPMWQWQTFQKKTVEAVNAVRTSTTLAS